MYKLIVITAAAMPTIFLLRALFVGRSPKPSNKAFSEFKKQIDYLVWAILVVIGCIFVYSVASLIHSMWR